MEKKRKQPGLSLIEVLMALSISFALLLGMLQLTLQALLLKKKSDCRLKTAELAAAKLEYFKSLSSESLEWNEESGWDEISGKGSCVSFRRVWRIEAISSTLKKIEMECFALDSPTRKSRLVLYRSQELGF